MVENPPASAGDTREAGLIPEVGNGTPTPVFFNRGAWQATGMSVHKSQTWLSNQATTMSMFR